MSGTAAQVCHAGLTSGHRLCVRTSTAVISAACLSRFNPTSTLIWRSIKTLVTGPPVSPSDRMRSKHAITPGGSFRSR